MTEASYSIVTITHNRDAHLANVLEGLAQQTLPPVEVVIVYMNQAEELQAPFDLPVVAVHLDTPGCLPLAEARNLGAERASQPQLVFLDVDCIPAPDMAATLVADLTEQNCLVMGTPRYLSPGFRKDHMWDDSNVHPIREHLSFGLQDGHTMFWSLCFAVGADSFHAIGGLDHRFDGYGAEDTDFAFSCRDAGIPLYLSAATAFHQPHKSWSPPVNHLRDIVRNALAFYEKRSTWPMEGWLKGFVEMGLIEWQPEGSSIKVLRDPTEQELHSCQKDASSRRHRRSQTSNPR